MKIPHYSLFKLRNIVDDDQFSAMAVRQCSPVPPTESTKGGQCARIWINMSQCTVCNHRVYIVF